MFYCKFIQLNFISRPGYSTKFLLMYTVSISVSITVIATVAGCRLPDTVVHRIVSLLSVCDVSDGYRNPDKYRFESLGAVARQVLSKEELEAAERRREADRDRRAAEALARLQALEAADLAREAKEAEAGDEIKVEARQRAKNIVDRAKIVRG